MLEMNTNIGLLLNTDTSKKESKTPTKSTLYDPTDVGRPTNGKSYHDKNPSNSV